MLDKKLARFFVGSRPIVAKAKTSRKSSKAKRTSKTTAKKTPAVKKKVTTRKKTTAKKTTTAAAKATASPTKKTVKKAVTRKAGAKKATPKKTVAKKAVVKKKTAGTVKKAVPATKKKVGIKGRSLAPAKSVRRVDVRPIRGSKPAPEPPIDSAIIIAGIEIVPRSRPVPKTKLRAKELREFKELLLTKRAALLGDVSQLSNEALNSNRQESRGDLSNMPSHMADVGSDNWEQEFTLGLIATERLLLRQIDDALDRIRNRVYGVCVATHRLISPERLRAKPWAQYCIEFARLRDAGRIPPGLV